MILDRYSIKYIWFLFFVLLAIVVAGCGDSDVATGHYYVYINGLDNYTGANTTEIYVPMPVINDSPVFESSQVQANAQGGAWLSTMSDTEKGAMIVFKTNNTSLTNISFHVMKVLFWNRTLQQRHLEALDMLDRPFSPSGGEPTSNPGPVPGSIGNSSTFVFIDKNLSPSSGNSSITIHIEFWMYEGAENGKYGGYPGVHIEEVIPAGVTGWVPVHVQSGGLNRS